VSRRADQLPQFLQEALVHVLSRGHGSRCQRRRPDTTLGVAQSDCVSTFVFRLIAPRPNFALDMSDEEREVMRRHAAHWQSFIEAGQMVVFGPVLDGTGSWGLGVIESDDEDELRRHAANDPVVTTGTGKIEMGSMLFGHVRPAN
jgi:uncharacterized protein